MFTGLPVLVPCGSQRFACTLEEQLFADTSAELVTKPE